MLPCNLRRERVMKPSIRYIATADQINLAWTQTGRGMPLVKAATWLTHLQYDLESPVWSHWIRFLDEHFRYIRYDERGCGMSDWKVKDLDLPRWVDDLESVVDAAQIDRPFALLGISQGAATAIRYAVRHPERVSHLILYGGYAIGSSRNPASAELYQAVQDVVRLGWGRDNPAFRQLFTSRFVPGGTQQQIDWFNELCRRTTSVENAGALLAARGNVDVREYLSQVRVPTLVLHASHDQIAPLSQGHYLAGHIPGATFVPLDSRNHVLLEHEPAWQQFQQAVLEFTGQSAQAARDAVLQQLTDRERMALRLLCEGRSNAQIGWELGISEKTVRNHVSNLYRKLGVRSRAEAIVLAHRQAPAELPD
ncbi:alpha/beta fold hydrolase [Agrilutibacter solisilvae]|uniref:Alpha/beta fold hydrolase n=1 Tax=Agrilutibacter solisilvae TaxID=2763317 RepID=A0A974Y054_9GAMM|nr:alpha/beta fold hydrolase [Lysobacter solisilvae]QSX78884.1 alpha/beta fold hydrolase [Lysobacter solisilvae]